MNYVQAEPFLKKAGYIPRQLNDGIIEITPTRLAIGFGKYPKDGNGNFLSFSFSIDKTTRDVKPVKENPDDAIKRQLARVADIMGLTAERVITHPEYGDLGALNKVLGLPPEDQLGEPDPEILPETEEPDSAEEQAPE